MKRPTFFLLLLSLGTAAIHCGGSPEESACDALCECPNQFGEDCAGDCAASFDNLSDQSASAGCDAEYDDYIGCFGDTLECDGEALTHDCRDQADALAACTTG